MVVKTVLWRNPYGLAPQQGFGEMQDKQLRMNISIKFEALCFY
jgi:hypothetical protein